MYKTPKTTLTQEEFEEMQKEHPAEMAAMIMEFVSPEKSKDFLSELLAKGIIGFTGKDYQQTILTLTHGRIKVGDASSVGVSTDGVTSAEAEEAAG